jgi:hypothetical protein
LRADDKGKAKVIHPKHAFRNDILCSLLIELKGGKDGNKKKKL